MASDYENVNMTPDYENVKADYTPTTETIRGVFSTLANGQASGILGQQFDRWLAEHDREVKAEAWDEGNAVDRRFNAPTPNPYREVSK